MIRECKSCGEDKGISQFPRRADCKGGISPRCKTCYNKSRKSRAGKASAKKYWSEWYERNKEKLLEKQKVDSHRKNRLRGRYQEKAPQIREQQRVYSQTIPAKVNKCFREAERRAAKLQATPVWLDSPQQQEIAEKYWLAKDVSLVSGCEYHVDHIVPLKGKDICGLHVPWNLQVLPADLNLQKSNKYKEN
jgi:hypothetical protein